MTTANSSTDLNVSLELHLIDTLQPLLSLLPEPLASQLRTALASAQPQDSPTIIPYSLLSSISAWTRSNSGRDKLRRRNPPLEANAYSMISLLAGTRTSPERKFPAAPVARDPEMEAKRERDDKRAVTALLNALLSILGSGAATWWAANMLAWKDEYKVLLALLVAVVVAVSEGILYLIWDARRSEEKSRFRRPLKIRSSFLIVEKDKGQSIHPPNADAKIAHSAYSALVSPTNPTEISATLNIQMHPDTHGLRGRTRQVSELQTDSLNGNSPDGIYVPPGMNNHVHTFDSTRRLDTSWIIRDAHERGGYTLSAL